MICLLLPCRKGEGDQYTQWLNFVRGSNHNFKTGMNTARRNIVDFEFTPWMSVILWIHVTVP